MAKSGKSQRGVIIIVAAAALLLAVVGAAAALFLLPVRSVSGQVIDSATGSSLAGAVLKVNGTELTAGTDGAFTVDGVRFGAAVTAEAPGYLAATSRVGQGGSMRLALAPRVLEGVVTDAATKKPLPEVLVKAGSLSAESDAAGKFKLVAIEPGTDVTLAATGFHPSTQKYADQASVSVALQPTSLTVKATNQYTGEPLPGAEVTDGRDTAQTDHAGTGRPAVHAGR